MSQVLFSPPWPDQTSNGSNRGKAARGDALAGKSARSGLGRVDDDSCRQDFPIQSTSARMESVQRCISKVISSSVNIPTDNITRLVKHLYESLQFLFLSHLSEPARNRLRNTIRETPSKTLSKTPSETPSETLVEHPLQDPIRDSTRDTFR